MRVARTSRDDSRTLWLRSTLFGDDMDRVLRRKDGRHANDGETFFLDGGYAGVYRHGYDGAFVGQLENFLSPGDVLFAISSSGNSPNVLNALLYGRERGARSIALVGFDGGEAARLADHVILVPTPRGAYGLVEGVHSVVHHLLCEHARRLEEP